MKQHNAWQHFTLHFALHDPVNQKHYMLLHKMMHTLKLKPELMEKISTMQQGPKWKPNLTLHIAESREKAKEEEAEQSRAKGYMDGSEYEGWVGAVAVLYKMHGAVRSRRRMRFRSIPHHTIYEGEGVWMVWFGADQRGVTCKQNDY